MWPRAPVAARGARPDGRGAPGDGYFGAPVLPTDPCLQLIEKEIVLKVLVVGGARVGKTTIVNIYSETPFTKRYVPTIGADETVVAAGTLARRRAYLRFCDVSHREVSGRPGHLALFSEGVAAVMLVVDVASLDSMAAADRWHHVLRQSIAGLGDTVPVMLVAHKADLIGTTDAVVTAHDLERYVERVGFSGWRFTTAAHHFGASVKAAVHATVDLVFRGSERWRRPGPVANWTQLPWIQQLLMSSATYITSPRMNVVSAAEDQATGASGAPPIIGKYDEGDSRLRPMAPVAKAACPEALR
eukprot:g2083.t1